MDGIIRRRGMVLPKDDEWETLIHNNFGNDHYVNHTASGGNVFVIKDGGEWVEIVSNGNNNNNSNLTTRPTFLYALYADKLCRLTWDIECSDPDAYTTATGAGNLSFGTYNTANPTYAGVGRVGKVDYATLANGKLIGRHTEEFILSELFSGVSKSTYFGWNFGFRSSVSGLTWRIMELTFEVHK